MARVGSPEPKRDGAPPPAARQRQREEVADQVEEVAHVVAQPEPLDHEAATRAAGRMASASPGGRRGCCRWCSWRAAPRRSPRRAFTSTSTCGSPSGVAAPGNVADVERRMRPGRHGEIFDHHRDVLVALDEEHVARPQDGAQRVGVGRRVGLVAGRLAPEPRRQPAADPVEDGIGGRGHRL